MNEGAKQTISGSISVPEKVLAGSEITVYITVTNNGQIIQHNSKIYFHPIGPATEMWWIKQWSPHVPIHDIPRRGVLFTAGDLAQGQSFALVIRVSAPNIHRKKEYALAIGFESSQKPRHTICKKKITVIA